MRGGELRARKQLESPVEVKKRHGSLRFLGEGLLGEVRTLLRGLSSIVRGKGKSGSDRLLALCAPTAAPTRALTRLNFSSAARLLTRAREIRLPFLVRT